MNTVQRKARLIYSTASTPSCASFGSLSLRPDINLAQVSMKTTAGLIFCALIDATNAWTLAMSAALFDGLGFVTAMNDNGCVPAGKKALLVGAGGAGSAIAHALVMAGVSELAIHEEDATRRETLVQRLASLNQCPVSSGSSDPSGFDIVLNATPVGMKETDAFPLQASKLTGAMFVGCVITQPAVTLLIAAARAKGCLSMTGADMFGRVSDLMIAFLVGE